MGSGTFLKPTKKALKRFGLLSRERRVPIGRASIPRIVAVGIEVFLDEGEAHAHVQQVPQAAIAKTACGSGRHVVRNRFFGIEQAPVLQYPRQNSGDGF